MKKAYRIFVDSLVIIMAGILLLPFVYDFFFYEYNTVQVQNLNFATPINTALELLNR